MEKIVSMHINGSRVVYGDGFQSVAQDFEFRGTTDEDVLEITNVSEYDLLIKHVKVEGQPSDAVDGFYVWKKGEVFTAPAQVGARYFIEATAI